MLEEIQEIEPSSIEQFVIMAKPVGPTCNLECRYCYYLETAHLFSHQKRFQMSDDILETYVRQYIAANPGPDVLCGTVENQRWPD